MAELRAAQAEIQRLRDEIARLKGEQGRPVIKSNTPEAPRLKKNSLPCVRKCLSWSMLSRKEARRRIPSTKSESNGLLSFVHIQRTLVQYHFQGMLGT